MQVRAILKAGDSLLLSTDLLKPIPQLLQAYDDPLGVTAAFNLNLLARINRELDGEFDLSAFRHEARFNNESGSIEMHLRSLRRQTVNIAKAQLSVTFEEDETIWTETSHKYSLNELCVIAEEAGFGCDAQWVDKEWPFSENLLIAQ